MKRGSDRHGRSSSAIALGLFLLSCILMVSVFQWAYTSPPIALSLPRDYVLKQKAIAERADKPLNPAPGSSAFEASRSYFSPSSVTQRMDGNTAWKEELGQRLKIRDWHYVAGLDQELAQFETVFWEPNDTDSLRAYLTEHDRLSGASVLEIGTGTGLVALVCARLGAIRVVATDINPAAFANAGYNAQNLGFNERVELRLVSREQPEPFSVMEPDERFDFIISNPPWEDATVAEVAAHALYDPGFGLLDSLLAEASEYLESDGELLLAYGAKRAIQRILDVAPEQGWQVEVADKRSLNELPEVFLPGMLLVLKRGK